jgi:hypothetical protein
VPAGKSARMPRWRDRCCGTGDIDWQSGNDALSGRRLLYCLSIWTVTRHRSELGGRRADIPTPPDAPAPCAALSACWENAGAAVLLVGTRDADGRRMLRCT